MLDLGFTVSTNIPKVGINIQPIDDPFARYKMPPISSRIKPKGQYSETYITNLQEIANSLKTPVEAIARFISFDLNTPVKSVGAAAAAEHVLKGSFTDVALLASLRKYIGKYILCGKCALPEITYTRDKKSLKYECAACGFRANNLDDRIYKLF
jgi:translation initiation factor 5